MLWEETLQARARILLEEKEHCLGLEKHIELETDYLSYCSGGKRVGFIVDMKNEEKKRRE